MAFDDQDDQSLEDVFAEILYGINFPKSNSRECSAGRWIKIMHILKSSLDRGTEVQDWA